MLGLDVPVGILSLFMWVLSVPVSLSVPFGQKCFVVQLILQLWKNKFRDGAVVKTCAESGAVQDLIQRQFRV